MEEFIDIASTLDEAREAAEAERKRQPIGFWRAFIALFMGVQGIFAGVVPGLIAMWSFERWMRGRSKRPVAAMAVGLIVSAAYIFLLLMVPMAILEESGSQGAEIGRTILTVYGLVALAITAIVAVRLGAYLFRTPMPSAAPPTPAAERPDEGTPVVLPLHAGQERVVASAQKREPGTPRLHVLRAFVITALVFVAAFVGIASVGRIDDPGELAVLGGALALLWAVCLGAGIALALLLRALWMWLGRTHIHSH